MSKDLGGLNPFSVKWKKLPTMKTCSRSFVCSHIWNAFVGKQRLLMEM